MYMVLLRLKHTKYALLKFISLRCSERNKSVETKNNIFSTFFDGYKNQRDGAIYDQHIFFKKFHIDENNIRGYTLVVTGYYIPLKKGHILI